jgi:hypothetical protein
MLAAVQFDDQPGFEAGKIEDVAVEGDLALELQAVELAGTKE